MKNILILSHEDDPHSESVKKHFDKTGINYFEVLTNKLISDYKITFDSSKGLFTIANSEKEILIDKKWNIWNRRVMDPEIPEGFPKNMEDIIFTETKRTWEGLLFSHEGKVINRPQAEFSANNKTDQLLFASKYGSGIKIPSTILTNNPQQFVDFYISQDKVSFKLQKAPIVEIGGGDVLTTYNNLVTKEQVNNSHLISNNPSLFQEYVDKQYELRITALEDKVVAIKIDSQSSEMSKVDFRRYDFEKVGYEYVELPKNVERFCSDLIRHYGLSFGAIDMIYSNKNEYVFLEINPNGQWLWLEEESGYNLTKDVAENLL